MKAIVLFTTLSLGVIFTSCEKERVNVTPSGNLTTTDVQVSIINKLVVSDMFNVFVYFSDEEVTAQLETNANVYQFVELSNQNGTFSVGLSKNIHFNGQPVLNLYINARTLSGLSVDGASSVEFQNSLTGNSLDMSVSGASSFKGSIETGELLVDLSGASRMELAGSSDYLDITGEGASLVDGFDFVTDYLDASLNGASEISVTVNQELDVRATGASKIYYKGDGMVVNSDIRDSSQLLKVN